METDPTTRVELILPESLLAFADKQRSSAGQASLSEYVRALLERELKAQERLEALLLEGLESGPSTEMTDADWDEMRRRFDERHGSAMP